VTRRDQAERVTALLRALSAGARPVRRAAQPAAGGCARCRRGRRRASRGSFGDLRQNPRYRAAAEFFVSELYGADDATWRDRDLARMLPKLKAWLPGHMLETVAGALELDS
jgi:hypothetical protein